MLIPVRCFTCGKVIGGRYEEYKRQVEGGKPPKEVLDKLGIERYCCRRACEESSVVPSGRNVKVGLHGPVVWIYRQKAGQRVEVPRLARRDVELEPNHMNARRVITM